MIVNGKHAFIEDHGVGPAIVMVHGLGGTTNVWSPIFGAIATGYRVVRMDLDGAGRTPMTGPISIDGLMRQVVGLMDGLGIDKAHLVGHSMGTIVCQHAGEHFPERVASLSLLGPMMEPPAAARSALADRALAARQKGMLPIAEAICQGATSARTKQKNPVAMAFIRELLMGQDAEGYASSCEALAAAQVANLAKITCPVMLATGDEDRVAPQAAMEGLAQRLTSVEMHLIENCGHWHTIEQPAVVGAYLKEFLAKVEST